MRGLKREEKAQVMMDAMRNYYNFIRPRQSLNGKTPAQKARVVSELESKNWLSLIKKASKQIRY